MPICPKCSTWLDIHEALCPICGAPKPDETPAKDTSPAQESLETTKVDTADRTRAEIERLYRRGIECMETARKWHAMKNKYQSNREYQRAIKYFERVLKLDPTHEDARFKRDRCLYKIV
jgi:tetratricopeptide (TPR) repeat protein